MRVTFGLRDLAEDEPMKDRFEWLMDPCDRYLVWDNESDAPAMCGRELIGCASAEEAASLAASMNIRARRRESVVRSIRPLGLPC